MTDKKYTNEDIISSLKVIATTGNCDECKIRNCKWGTCNCSQITANAALELIKPQKIEIERLRKEVNLVSIQFQDLQERYEEAQAEIKRLNAENMLTISERNAFRTSFYDVLEQLKTAKSEAYKECLAKVKNYTKTHCNPYGKPDFDYDTSIKILNFIDNLAKEMAGE